MSLGRFFGRNKNIGVQPWLLDFQWLYDNVEIWRQQYRDGDPFPHIVLDNFLSPEIISQVVKHFHGEKVDQNWRQFDAYAEDGSVVSYKKKDSSDILSMHPTVRQLIWELNSKPFLPFLHKLTAIPRIISDPLCYGGGLHEIPSGGLLKVHADFHKHPIFKLDRRLNLILYLNESWKEEYGGHLELWNKDVSSCVQKILPVAGRCVIFTTSDHSFHGHPQPLTCPANRSRKSLALYYYTNGLDDSPIDTTARTYWQATP